jgi:hypothetical protein
MVLNNFHVSDAFTYLLERHTIIVYALVVTIVLHVTGAIKHHFLDRNFINKVYYSLKLIRSLDHAIPIRWAGYT